MQGNTDSNFSVNHEENETLFLHIKSTEMDFSSHQI